MKKTKNMDEPAAQAVTDAYFSPLDKQVGGSHYKNFKIQPVEFITQNNLGYCEGNVIKYVCRHQHKNGVADIDKAIHYLELLKDQVYGGDK